MNETHPNLAAWLDGELPAAEAAGVARHLASCESCRRQCAAFRDTSAVVQLYCHAAFAAARATPRLRGWVPAFTALAALACFTIFLAFPRKHAVAPSSIPSASAVVRQTPVPAEDRAVQATPKVFHRHHAVSASPRRVAAAWPAADTEVEIAIPADAVFAPGALPEGLRLFGEMRINPDGSLREIRLRQ